MVLGVATYLFIYEMHAARANEQPLISQPEASHSY